jgi:hypothetical protein
MQASAARRANRAQQAAAQQQRADLTAAQQGFQPYTQFGQNALGRISAVEGGDYSAFENAPDYVFARDQGIRSLDRSAAARGGLFSGGADADRMQFASGLASQNLQNYLGRQMGQAGMGMQAQGQVAGLYRDMAGVAGQAGQASANSAIQQGNAWGGALNQISGVIGSGMGGGFGKSASVQKSPLGSVWGSSGGIGAGLAGGTRYGQPVQPNNPFAQWGI